MFSSFSVGSVGACPTKSNKVPPEEEIVISGISGRYPESHNVEELFQNLINKKDMITDDDRRWRWDSPEVPQRFGKIHDVEKFDALFFGVHSKQVHSMDPGCRVLLECAYEAIVDAGINPKTMRNRKTGVFVGSCVCESEKTWLYEKLHVNGLGVSGCSRSMLANRISYWLGVNGPSYAIDSACSSSLTAMEHAYRAIRNGECDSAVVGGTNLCLHPHLSLTFAKMGLLSPDGRSKTFDESADGYARSEAIAAIFLQKAKDAKRIYATCVHAKTNCDGFKEQGITFPSHQLQSVLLDEFYRECDILPSRVSYVEAHGTGTRVGDPEEIRAIDAVLGKDRTRDNRLLVGSVKSNLGHSEASSGLVSISKVVLAMENGVIPPQLNYKNPREEIRTILEERLKIISEATPWKGGYAGVNSFGFGGANVHILLKSHPKEKINNGTPRDDLPRVIVASGRTDEAVDYMLKEVESRPVDVEYVKLLHDLHSDDINGHLSRGYTILPARGKLETTIREIKAVSPSKRPVWYVFSGMGSQWAGMGEDLLRIPTFAAAMRKIEPALKARDVDIYEILTSKEKVVIDNILHSFVGISAIQIGLVDVLKSIGIEPDNVIGHSAGELGCAYADGSFTAEEMILSAYSRGMACIESDIVFGSMAAIGLGYKDIKDLCPPDIEVACHNSAESTTISGPAESMKAFIAELQAKNIFAKEVPCRNIPYHSSYIAPVKSKLLGYLKKILPNPKPRSSKWLSTSVPMNKWNTMDASYSSAKYFVNNLINTVLFEEALALVPDDAIIIEIAPHGLLQAILRRSLPPSVTNIPLTQRNQNVEVFLGAIGKMYNAGLQPQLANLYPSVEYPVSRSTRMISPLVKWEHSENWFVTSYKSQQNISSGERIVTVSLADSNYEHLSGHMIDGRNLYPATGYIHLVWETIAMMHDQFYAETSVVFEDVKFLRATNIPKDKEIEFTILIHKGTGRFEIVEGNVAVVTGQVRLTKNPVTEKIRPNVFVSNKEEVMSTSDIYKELRLRGYHYQDPFRCLLSATCDGSKGHIVCTNNWVAFMDNMLQFQILSMDTRGLFVPTSIKKLTIDAATHLSQMQSDTTQKEGFSVHYSKLHDTMVCGGVEIRGLKSSAVPRKKFVGNLVLEEYKFIPFADRAQVNLREISRLCTHIGWENHQDVKIKTIEVIDETDQVPVDKLLSPWFSESLGDLPLIQADISIVSVNHKTRDESLPDNVQLIGPDTLTGNGSALLAVGHRLLSKDRSDKLAQLLAEVKQGGFLLSRENIGDAKNVEEAAKAKGLHVILEKKSESELFVLLRKQVKSPERTLIIKVSNDTFDWVDKMRETMTAVTEKETTSNTQIILVGQGDFENGLMGLINCLREEPGGEIIRGVLIQDSKAPEFSVDNPLYSQQLQKNLTLCVLSENGIWGTYRHLPLPPLEPKPVYHSWLNETVRGDLSSFKWLEGPIRLDDKNKNLVYIHYSSINFKDVMLATGKLAAEVVAKTRQAQECILGFEYSGIDASGKRIMGLKTSHCLANMVIPDEYLSWKIPDEWSLEEAATVPCVYGTCLYALYIQGRIQKGEKILIHAGTGGVGQAAIHLALHEGCEVFTTVGTPEKRQFIRKHFPQIPDDHIGNSRDTSFEQMIMEKTNGQGVDIVLNSLAEEKLLASVACLACRGRFLEIGKFDLSVDNPLGMECFLKEVSFQGVMLDRVLDGSLGGKEDLAEIMNDRLKKGAIKPLVRTVFPKEQVQEAFRYMAGGKHIGKVIIKVRDEKEKIDSLSLAIPQYHCLPNRSYIILGGLGGFGLELVDWLVLRGAKHIIITSRAGIRDGYQKLRIELWKSYGVNVVVIAGKESSNCKDCQAILDAASKIAPVDGIFNLAAVLKDALWNNQTPEYFEESFRSKARTTKNLDVLTRKLCPTLRNFVVFSSLAAGRGNAGQSNYGMSNSVMERICERRVKEGLPGLAVQWGPIADVGMVQHMQKDDKDLIIGGLLQQRISSCLQELDGFLQQKRPVVSSMLVAEKKTVGEGALNLVDTVINIMGLKDLKGVSLGTSLAELGMDSMMSVEIKQTLEREFEIFLTAQDIRGLSFSKLQQMSEVKKGETVQAVANNIVSENSEDNIFSGMSLLMRRIGDIGQNPEPCLRLNTKEEQNRSHSFLIPGIECVGDVFATLAPKLRSPSSCLQLSVSDHSYKTVFEMADYLLPYVLKNCKGSSFTITGYSFGTLIAIELARRLETKGYSGQLILIDGAPDILKFIQISQIKDQNESEVQNLSLRRFAHAAYPTIFSRFDVELEKCTTWDSKLQLFKKLCPPEQSGMNEKVQKDVLTAAYIRTTAMITYDVSKLKPITAPITLLKPTTPIVPYNVEDYGLSKITTGKVDVYHIPGNHVTMIDNDNVVYAINGEPIKDVK